MASNSHHVSTDCPECDGSMPWDELVEHVQNEHGWSESDVELLSLEVP